jgi:hypothetical protein
MSSNICYYDSPCEILPKLVLYIFIMKERSVTYSQNKKLDALRALGKNKDYTVSELPAAKGMVIFINGVPMIPYESKVNNLKGNT